MKAKLNLVLALILFLGMFNFAIVNQAKCAHWEWQNPLPTGDNYQDGWQSGNEIFAVGNAGAISHFDGSVWTIMDSGTSENLFGVWGSSVNNVFAVGNNGTILQYNGTTWTPMTSNTAVPLYGIWGSAGNNVYAVGQSGTIVYYNGSIWTVMSTPSTAPILRGVWGTSGGADVYAVGSSGTIWHYTALNGWQEETSPTGNALNGIWGTSNTDLYAAGSGGIILQYTIGAGWQPMTPVPSTSVTLYKIWGVGTDIFVVGSSGSIWRKATGVDWEAMTSGTTNTLSSISGSAANDISVVGYNGIVLQYDGNIGNTWSSLSSNVASVGLEDIYGSSSSNVYAVGYTGTILQYNSSIWSQIPTTTTDRLNGVWVSSNGHVFAVGDNGIIVHYDGNAWTESSPTTENLYEVWGSSDTDVFAVGHNGTILRYNGIDWSIMGNDGVTEQFVGIWGSSGNDVFVLGLSGAVLHFDGGIWTQTDNLQDEFDSGDIWGSSGSDVYAGGRYGVLYHYNGNTWRQLDDLGYDDLDSIWGSSADNIYAVSGSQAFHYDGYVWVEISTPVSLYSVWGSSASDVFGVGSSGRILHYALDTYYVDMARPDDNGDGTSPATAWKYLHTAVTQINSMPAGNYRIQVAAGTYSVSNGEADADIIITRDNIMIQGEAGAILDGEYLAINSWDFGVVINASNVVLRDLGFTGFRGDAYAGVLVNSGELNMVENCDIYDNDRGIRLDSSSTDTVVVASDLYGNDTAILSEDAGMDVIGNKIYENNYGIELTNYSASISLNFFNNLFYGTTAEHLYGIRVDAYGAITNITAYHNTITGIANSVYLFYSGQTASLIANLQGNIIANADIGLVVDDGIGGTWSGGDYNTVFNCTTSSYGANVTPGTNDRTDDPLFVDAATFDFHLQNTSPSRDHIPISGNYPVIYDLDGVDRPQGAGYDIGAYEYVDVQRNALIDLYNRTNGDNWIDNSGWKDNNPDPVDGFSEIGSECTWYGVTCDVSDNAIRVELQSNNLVGAIPATLENLTSLDTINLGTNQLSGTIPPVLGNLSALVNLRLDNNQITGTIPTQLGNFTNLATLFLHYNQLTGTIPTQLGGITSLVDLRLLGNQLSGAIPAELGSLTNLINLRLSGNQFTSIPPELGNLDNLEILWLNGNQLAGSIPPELGNLGSIQDIRLYANNLTGSIPVALGNMTTATRIELSTNQLSGSIPIEFGNLTNLVTLNLQNNQLTGTIPSQFSSLTNIEQLDLGNNQLTGPLPLGLWGLTGMTSLDLADNDIGGSIPIQIGNLTSLAALYLDDNQLSGPIPAELGSLTALQYLTLHGNQLSGGIPTALSGLTSLLDGLSDFRWNALYASDSGLETFLNAKQNGGDWQSTQTIDPTNLAAGSPTETSISLIWEPIVYQGDFGGYEHYYATTSGGPYTLFGTTDGKAAPGATITGLSPNTTYYFRVRTFTDIHTYNANGVYSEYTNEVSATTTGGVVITQYTLTVNTVGQGVVKTSPPGSTFDAGTPVTLTPVADEGWVFSSWSGDLTGSVVPGSITMNADQTVTANFVEKSSPEPPLADGPADESIIDEGSPVTLDTSDYNDPDGDQHFRSHWEVWRADTETLLEGYPMTFTQEPGLTVHDIMATLDAGLKYVWRVGYEDMDGNVSWSQEYIFKVGTPEPDTLPEVPAGTDVGDFGMISIVHWPNDPSPTAVFNIDYDPSNYRIGTYNALTGSYIEFGEGLEMEPGQSYWILAREGLVINFNGIPVSLIHDIEVCLHVNEAAGNGWNMIAPPNEANYLWGDVLVGRFVEGSPGLTVAPMSLSDADSIVDTLIDRRIWQWESGAYVSYLPAENFELQSYSGYWVNAKLDGVYLVFPESAQVAGLSTPGNTMLALKGKVLQWLKDILPETRAAVADNDMPPMPMQALDDHTVDPVFQGCFIDILED